MTRSVRARGVAAAVFIALFGAPVAQAQVAQPVASVPHVVTSAVFGAQAGEMASRLLLPKTVTDTVARPASPNIFGTVSLAAQMQPIGTRWGRLMTAPLDQPALVRLTQPAAGLSRDSQAAFVQSAVARAVRGSSSTGACADDGYWASANETLTLGKGDCIDIAIAKAEALRLLGVPEKDLYLTRGSYGGNRETMALLVRTGDEFLLLPAHGDQVILAGNTSAAFQPSVTYGLGTNWVHGHRTAPAASS